MTESFRRQPQLGDWFTVCCHLDLRKLDSEESLQRAVESKEAFAGCQCWPSLEEALAEIKASFGNAWCEEDEVHCAKLRGNV